MRFADPGAIIDALLYDLAVKNEQIVVLTADCESFRLLAHVAVKNLAEVTAQRDRLAARNRELLAEHRDLRHEASEIAA